MRRAGGTEETGPPPVLLQDTNACNWPCVYLRENSNIKVKAVYSHMKWANPIIVSIKSID